MFIWEIVSLEFLLLIFGVCELMNNYSSDVLDTGWRGSDTFFVVVIERQDLDSMVGEVLNKE